jgi:hypothetical protein
MLELLTFEDIKPVFQEIFPFIKDIDTDEINRFIKTTLHVLVCFHEIKAMRCLYPDLEPHFRTWMENIEPIELKQIANYYYHRFTIIGPLNNDPEKVEIKYGGGQKIKYIIPLWILNPDRCDTLVIF